MVSIYIFIAIISLAVSATIFSIQKKDWSVKLSKLSALSFVTVVAGIVFRENHLLGYSLVGVGITMAAIDVAIMTARN